MHGPGEPPAIPSAHVEGESPEVVPDPLREPFVLSRSLLSEVYEHARECYPEECCGILTGVPAGPPNGVVRFVNLQNRQRAAGHSDLDARSAFWIDVAELQRTIRELEGGGYRMRAVYHSHTDGGAYLSHTDVRAALGPEGRPLWPDVGHLVVSVQAGTVREAAYFEWDAKRRAFVGRRVQEES
jgi:proteasome lid subunit RPN8/RPN11